MLMPQTVSFSKNAINVFFHILTRCNLSCRHCYINPAQHGDRTLALETIAAWLAAFVVPSRPANLVLLGGEPTLHPDLAAIVAEARRLGYASVTIDTNGYLFHDIIKKVTPEDVDFFSFSLDGPTPEINDPIRGKGSFAACTAGIRAAKARGFHTSLIYTVSAENIAALDRMPPLLADLGIERFFIQVIGMRGKSAAPGKGQIQVNRDTWLSLIPDVAARTAELGITTVFPKVFLAPDEPFECAGLVAENFFIFPNGRVYRCPLCEDHPLHCLEFADSRLIPTPKINENDLFALNIPEGCVMNKLIQPGNLTYRKDGSPAYRIACCLLKEEVSPGVS
jgi:MoaA/NifB/PqqE/SkfB family radical SAM enzyme